MHKKLLFLVLFFLFENKIMAMRYTLEELESAEAQATTILKKKYLRNNDREAFKKLVNKVVNYDNCPDYQGAQYALEDNKKRIAQDLLTDIQNKKKDLELYKNNEKLKRRNFYRGLAKLVIGGGGIFGSWYWLFPQNGWFSVQESASRSLYAVAGTLISTACLFVGGLEIHTAYSWRKYHNEQIDILNDFETSITNKQKSI